MRLLWVGLLIAARADSFNSRASFIMSPVQSRPSRKSSTLSSPLFMVADEPEAAIEESATRALLDQILDESLRVSARRPLMKPFNPAGKAMWKHWRGTVWAETWTSAVKHMLWAATVYLIFQRYPKVKAFLHGFGDLWVHTLSVTTFTLSFFLSQAYTLWKSCLGISRTLQGRINDLMMMLSAHAERIEPEDTDGYSTYTPSSEKFLRIVSRHLRVFNILAYGSFTRSYRPLLTPQGMRRMVARGLITEKERKALTESRVAATQRFNAVLLWILRSIVEGRRKKILVGDFGFEQQAIMKVQDIRMQANSIECELRGRMPFAYAHIVQVLVDAAIWLYPVAAFSGTTTPQLGILGTGFLSFAYQGLFDLSKQFLDPYHNENFWKGHDALVVDTIVAETNAGSLRFWYGLEEMPIASKSFESGNLDDHVLPDEGFTRTEAAQRWEDQNESEATLQSGPLTLSEQTQMAADTLEAYQEEYQEAQMILNAPPASDFVPGLDDAGESLDYYNLLATDENRDATLNAYNTTEADAGQIFEMYVDAAEEEFQNRTIDQSEFQ